MYKIFVFVFFLLLEIVLPVRVESGLFSSLLVLGFENISIGSTDNSDWIIFEDRINRNSSDGIEEVIHEIIDSPDIQKETDIILLRNRLPVLKCHLSKDLITDYKKGIISFNDVLKGVIIVNNTDDYRQGLKKGRVVNSSSGKIDLVVYPQVGLANYRLDKLYMIDISVAPALKMQLWPGAKFTGQVIFPVYNNLKGEVDYIRPGIVVLSQSLHLRDNVFGCLSVGNFTEDRMGVDAELNYRSNKGYWGIGANVGLTGSSTFYDGRWEVSDWKRVNFALKTFFYEPVYNLQFDLSIGQYIYGDCGGRLDCRRHFGEILVGVFAMYSGKVANGGFLFSIPLPGRKRKRSKKFPIRVMLPEYFDWEYEAQCGPDYLNRRLGRSYRTDNDRNDEYRFNPLFIKSNLRIK